MAVLLLLKTILCILYAGLFFVVDLLALKDIEKKGSAETDKPDQTRSRESTIKLTLAITVPIIVCILTFEAASYFQARKWIRDRSNFVEDKKKQPINVAVVQTTEPLTTD